MPRKGETTKQPEGVSRNDRLRAMTKVAGNFAKFRPVREVLRKVRAVPTIFAQFDHATRVNGFPIDRISTIHGPSNHGKTIFAAGVGYSFLKRDHFFHLIDVERTTPITWLEQLYGEHVDHPGFSASRPATYEEAVDEVAMFCNGIGDAKARGELPNDTSGLIVIDSVRKLVPKGLLAKIMKSGADEAQEKFKKGARKGIDGLGGRAAQFKAALNSQWLDELVPLLEQTGCGLIFIARETEDPDADPWDEKAVKVGGGGAIIYDSSLVARIQRASWVSHSDKEGENKVIYGERHKVTIRKTKVGEKDSKQAVCYFHTSNGNLTPSGFDPARDLVELAAKFDVIKKAGAWFTWGKVRWCGVHQAVKRLSKDPEMFARFDSIVRERFAEVKPEEVEVTEEATIKPNDEEE